jgi:hypothetical protein
MIRSSLLIIIVISLLGISCSSRKSKLDSKGLIPEKELISIIKDIYIADALLSIPNIHNKYSNLDSLTTYVSIIERHGYTKESMDKTLKYYFIKKPKKLIALYDQVLGIYSKQESLLEKKTIIVQRNRSSFWTGDDSYSFFGSGGADSTMFTINLYNQRTYALTFSATLYPDDQSLNPRITLFTCNADSIESGIRRNEQRMIYIKDGQPHLYSFIIKVPKNTILQVKGRLYEFDNNPLVLENHAIFEDISFGFATKQR